jgi:hypothetical protein
MDLDVLALMRERRTWERYSRFIKLSSLGELAATIFGSISEWYALHPDVEVLDWKAFSAWFALVRHAKLDKTKLKNLLDVITRLQDHEAGDATALIAGLAKRDYAAQIADVALRIADGDYKLSMNEIDTLVREYQASTGELDAISNAIGSFSLDELSAVSDPGFQWRLSCLNDALGDLRQGDLVVFGKRPDAGGTTFVASESTFMAEQMGADQCVLWINNEESGAKVRYRIVQSALGWTSEKIDADPAAALAAYTDLMAGDKDKIKVYDRPSVHTRDVEELLRIHKPGLIIFDQLWKVKGFDGENDAARQTLLFNWARELAKEYAPVIAVHQAGGEAEGMRWIPMSMLYMGKTGPQGEADAIIMLGRDFNLPNSRFLYVPKNKLHGGRDKSKRNGRFELTIDTQRARFIEPK